MTMKNDIVSLTGERGTHHIAEPDFLVRFRGTEADLGYCYWYEGDNTPRWMASHAFEEMYEEEDG